MPNMPARLTNPLGIILVVMLLLVIRVQAALRWRTLLALSALMPCPASPNWCACSNAQSIIRGTGQPRCELGYCQGSRVGQPEKGVDVSGCLCMEDELCWAVFQAALLMERADVCLTNGWLRSIAFQAAVVMNISNAKHRFQLFNLQHNKTTQQPCRHTK